jgi:hypothetical protein
VRSLIAAIAFLTRVRVMIGDPSAAMDTDGRLEVFVLGTDHSIWHLAQTTGASRSWTGWNGLGGYSISNPATARDADGRIELYVGGRDNMLWYRAQTSAGSTSWTTWADLGGNVAEYLLTCCGAADSC